MSTILDHTSSVWKRYNSYQIKTSSDGTRYVTASEDASIVEYDMMADADTLILDTLNFGLQIMINNVDRDIQESLAMKYVSKYGLMGFMTALTSNPKFIGESEVYLTKNQFLKDKWMVKQDYLDMFFPFGAPEKNEDIKYLVSDRMYAENLEWIIKQLKSYAYMFSCCKAYYGDMKNPDPQMKHLVRYAVALFDTNAPFYHIGFSDDHPVMVWDFHSLALCLQMIICLAVTDDYSRFKMCKNCNKFFISDKGQDYCCEECER